jgi:hypothetical protein
MRELHGNFVRRALWHASRGVKAAANPDGLSEVESVAPTGFILLFALDGLAQGEHRQQDGLG